MKTIVMKLLPGIVMFGLLTMPAFGQTKIATVDLLRIFNGYWKTEQANSVIRERQEELAKTEREQLDGWQKAKDDYQKLLTSANDQAVSAEERDRRKKEAEDKLKEIQQTQVSLEQFNRQALTTLNEQRLRMRDNIVTEIRAAISARAKAGGYTLVIDTAAKSEEWRTPVVLYSAGEADLTEQVLAQLNTSAPVAPPTTGPTRSSTNRPAAR